MHAGNFQIPSQTVPYQWVMKDINALFEHPTLAKLLKLFGAVFDELVDRFDLDTRCADVPVEGFITKVKGLYVSLPAGLSDPVQTKVLEFTKHSGTVETWPDLSCSIDREWTLHCSRCARTAESSRYCILLSLFF